MEGPSPPQLTTARLAQIAPTAAPVFLVVAPHESNNGSNVRVSITRNSCLTQGLNTWLLTVNSPSLEHSDVGRALANIRDADAWWVEKYCLLFIALTCVRGGEAREATWGEINLDEATWKIPATRMKAGIEHKVPLSTQAIEILLYARDQGNGSQGKIFPSQRGGKFTRQERLSRLMHKLEIPAVPHGFRSSFINWAAGRGRTHIPEAAADMVLAHTPTEAVKKAYKTSDFFEDRVPVMQEWADYLTETLGPVISTIPDTYEEKQRERRTSSRVRTFKVDPIGEDEYTLIVQNLQESQTHDTWDAPDQDTLRGAVDVAAIALMRDGLLRPKETADALWSDLKREVDGSGLLTIRHSKKNRPGDRPRSLHLSKNHEGPGRNTQDQTRAEDGRPGRTHTADDRERTAQSHPESVPRRRADRCLRRLLATERHGPEPDPLRRRHQ